MFENSNIKKSENNKNKKQKTQISQLENQIETMLDEIIGDEDGDEINLKFSDDESSKSSNNIIYMEEENESSINLFNNISQSEDIDLTNNLFPYQRSEKKYSTVSFQEENFDNFPNYFDNNQSNLSLFSPNYSFINGNFFNQNINNGKNSFYQNYNLFNQNPSFNSTNYSINSTSLREDKKKTAYDLNNDQYILVNNLNINVNVNINNNHVKSVNNLYNLNSNLNPNLLNQNNFYLLNNQNLNIPQMVINNNSLKLFNNTNLKQNNNNIKNKINNNNEQFHKKFLTTTIPQGTNMQIEILLFELNSVLTKTEKIDYYIYNKLQGNFVNIIKTHRGSRIFQNYLKNTHSEIIHKIFLEVNPYLTELIIDSYANYFCKRFFNYLNQKDRIDFLLSIKDSLTKISINNIGTYPIQGIIEQIGSKNEKKIIINSIKDSINDFCYDTYGTHVLEKIISCFEEEFTEFIFEYVSNNFLNLSNNINGICIVKKILSLTYKKEIHEKLKKIINENAFNLIQHSYGNYVIQIIIETWDINEILEILSNFHNKYSILSMLKYSSNVVERCIEKSEIILKEYINEICSNGKIAEIMKNNFGNYVIQKALKLSINEDKKKLAEEVDKNIYKLNDRKLILKWKSIVNPHLENCYLEKKLDNK